MNSRTDAILTSNVEDSVSVFNLIDADLARLIASLQFVNESLQLSVRFLFVVGLRVDVDYVILDAFQIERILACANE